MNKKKDILINLCIDGAVILSVWGVFGFVDYIKDMRSERTVLEEKIVSENLSDDTRIERLMFEQISIKVDDVNEQSFSLTVEAPNIAEELFDWVSEHDDITAEEFEIQVKKLLNETEKDTSTYTLDFDATNEKEILYSAESRDALSCGMISFYNMAMEKVVEDIKEEMK